MAAAKARRGASQARRVAVRGPHVFVRRSSRAPARTGPYKRAVLVTLARAAPHVRGDVTLMLTSDRMIRRLNRRWRGRDRATDVLSFPLGDGAREGEPFGDVVVSVDSARRQARAYGESTEAEIKRLTVHGTLHLCGYDHHERREAARMHGLTRRLLRALARRG